MPQVECAGRAAFYAHAMLEGAMDMSKYLMDVYTFWWGIKWFYSLMRFAGYRREFLSKFPNAKEHPTLYSFECLWRFMVFFVSASIFAWLYYGEGKSREIYRWIIAFCVLLTIVDREPFSLVITIAFLFTIGEWIEKRYAPSHVSTEIIQDKTLPQGSSASSHDVHEQPKEEKAQTP